MPVDGRWLLRAVVLVAALLIGTYGRTLDNAVMALDSREVIDNYYLGDLGLSAKLFVVNPGQAEGFSGRYTPLTGVSLAGDRTLWGGEARGYRISSLVLHGISSLLLFLILARFGIAPLWALLAALLFTVHPVHTQAVNLISSRGHILSGALALAAIFFASGPLLRVSGPRVGRPKGSRVAMILFFAGLFCGWEAVAVLPFAALLPLAVSADRARWRYYAGLGVAVVVYMAAAVAAGGFGSLGLAEARWGAASVWKGLVLAVTARGQMIFHPQEYVLSWTDTRILAALALVAILALGALLLRARSRAISPTLCFIASVVVGTFLTATRDGVLREPGLYMLVAGVCAAAAVAVDLTSRARGVRAAAIAVLVVLVGLSLARSAARCGVWSSPERVWTEVLDAYPNSGVAVRELAELYRATGRPEKAASLTSPQSDDARSRAIALNNEGVAMRDSGRMTLAVEKLRAAIDLWPDFRDAHFNLGVVYHSLGMGDSAAASLERAVRADPLYADARYNLGIVYSGLRDYDAAEEEYREAVRIDPKYAKAWANLGSLLARRGDVAGAIRNLERALEIDPGLLQARSSLALAYERVDVRKAKEQWRAYLELARRRGVDPERIRQIEARLQRL